MSSDCLDRVFIGEVESKKGEGDETKNQRKNKIAGAERQYHDWATVAPSEA